MWSAEKARIAAHVARQIPDGATLFVDIGTTPEAHALLGHKNLRVVTNDLNMATLLTAKEDFRLILAGGEVRTRDGGIIGEATLDFISQFQLDYGILGIDLDGTLLELDYHEVRTKRVIIDNSRCVMLVNDHSKFGRKRHGQSRQNGPDGLSVYRPTAAAGRDDAYRTLRCQIGAVLSAKALA